MYSKYEELLKKNNVKSADVCRATGISAQIITNWKKKGKGSLNAENMKKIADYFKVSLGYFYDTDEEYEQAFYKAHTEQIKECRLSSEAQEIARAYMEAPEAIKEAVAKLLDVKRALGLSKEA